MGLFRKITSVSTLGAVDFRSDKERTARKTAKGARYSKVAAKEAQAQTRIMQADMEDRQRRDDERRQREASARRREAAAAAAATTTTQQPATRPLPERLAELNTLCEQGIISASERDARRAEILREV